MHEATQILRNEHDVILSVLDATEATANAIEASCNVSVQYLQDAVEFLRWYTDHQHHGKEEDLLFPALEKKGMPRNGGPIGMMLMEHTFGRSPIARMPEAASAPRSGDRAATATWADAALDSVALLREHIAKENQILFVMAERILSADDQARLFVEFAGVDDNMMGEGEEPRLLQLAERPAGGFRAYDSHQARRKIGCGRDYSTAFRQSKRNSRACRKSPHPAFN